MIDTKKSDDRIGAFALLLLILYWVWASAWPPVASTSDDSIRGSVLALQSGGDTTLQAAQLSGNAMGVQAGVINGQTVNPAAQIHIDAAINDHSSSRSSTGHDLFTQSSAGQGDLTQTLQYTTLNAPGADQPGAVQLQAPGGLTVGASSLTPVGAGNAAGAAANSSAGSVPTLTLDLKQQAQQLATQPGLGYMAQLAQRNDVAWQQVQLAAQHWDYSQSGLTGAAAAIIAIVVAVVTYGAASAWSASMMAGAGMTTTAGAAGTSTVAVAGAGAGMAGSAVAGGSVLTTTGAALSSAAAAGMSSLASEAAVSLTGNGGRPPSSGRGHDTPGPAPLQDYPSHAAAAWS
jgi:large exoprotein involved in heme utilization and adhesion